MHNIVRYQTFISAGVSTRTIRQALACCLLKLSCGVYSVVVDCHRPEHRRIAAFIDDRKWTSFHEQRTAAELEDDYKYQEVLQRLRICHYPCYRGGDVIWGISAAHLHEIPLFGVATGPISVLHPTSASRSSQIARTARAVDDADLCCVESLTATSPYRTSLDLIRILGQQAAFAAAEATLRRSLLGKTEPDWLRFGYPDEFTALGRERVVDNFYPVIGRLRQGRVTARRLVDNISPLSESIAESYCSFCLHAVKLGGFEQQVKIADGRGTIARVDFLHRESMTILEVDGVGKYVKVGRDKMSRESYQHNRLLALGYTVVRFRFRDLLNPSDFAAKLFSQAPRLKRFVRR
ncbi:hypothetical protein DFO66_11628 [Brevibacterium sanguinis]|uniref:Very-short-patch-repair endonuclease n=2 Tax=Brevibacterium TaxID=1696 RepID=A0A366IHY6_9MICO|nr:MULTISPECIES: hypothetical protein [Brevibacterium]RBP62212.1 hypothetical protein DFO66_11628 [Brevibacterium sanguinis]RBP70656.1 hypothetical protein DFO65_108108 [Brevibacterium celere]